ncbi:MAG: diacylglycerol kinase family lipid kinase [Cytophagaceae bacterium]|nr:diacylglycerol kinase family lipid kinase [Cytophagaceae bacterium]
MKEKIAFIINPISGGRSKTSLPDLINKHLDQEKFSHELLYTERRNHAHELAKEALGKGIKRIIAAGGDGTINEVAKALIKTEGILGVIPCGSGNGLARHLTIPLVHSKAIAMLNKDHHISMDVAFMNEHPFFCTSGVGFDAHIGKLFALKASRGFKTYIKTSVTEFISYKAHQYSIAYEDKNIDTKAFLITIGNTSQYGNNAFICPWADVQDGLLDVNIISPFPKIFALDLGRRLFNKVIHKSRYSTLFQTSSLTIKRKSDGPVHIDGEPMEMGKELQIKISPASLNIFVP